MLHVHRISGTTTSGWPGTPKPNTIRVLCSGHLQILSHQKVFTRETRTPSLVHNTPICPAWTGESDVAVNGGHGNWLHADAGRVVAPDDCHVLTPSRRLASTMLRHYNGEGALVDWESVCITHSSFLTSLMHSRSESVRVSFATITSFSDLGLVRMVNVASSKKNEMWKRMKWTSLNEKCPHLYIFVFVFC